MRVNSLVLRLGLVGLIACGGGKGGKDAQAGSQSGGGGGEQQAALFAKNDSGMPNWVNRGSAAVKDAAGNNVFYGVGIANAIKNPALLRSTADNRARAEIGKLIETFSASLMKDYMADSNGQSQQAIEQAVKTASSTSLQGTQIVDRYVDAQGNMYALASLELDTVAKAVQQAFASGAAKSHGSKVSVDDIFEKQAKKEEPPPPLKAEGSAGASGGKPNSGGATTAKGDKPAWVDGEDSRYSRSQYLCAVGVGPKREIAENGAYSAISRVFSAQIASVSKDFMGSYSATGAQTVEVQSTEQLTQVGTEKILTGIEIKELWQAKDSTQYALGCIERAKAVASLREKIEGLDEETGKYLEQSTKADKAGRVGVLAKALNRLVEREVLNGELRVVHAQGFGIASPYSAADVAAAFEAAVDALKVGVVANGPYSKDFYGELTKALTKKGFKVTDLAQASEDDMDVLVKADIQMEGSEGANSMYFARGIIQIELKNVAKNQVFASFDQERKEGHRNKSEAERRVVQKLSLKLSNDIGNEIDKAMRGG